MGSELGIPPMQAIQNIAVINGRPGIFGDLGRALLLKAGCVIEDDDAEVVKKNNRARCRITRPGKGTVEKTFSVEDAKTAKLWEKEGPWKQYPYRMLAWRAFWFAARDIGADLLKGLAGAEELMDFPPEKVVDTTTVPMPKRSSEVTPPPDKPAAPAAELPAPKSETPVAPVASHQGDLLETAPSEPKAVLFKTIDYEKNAEGGFHYYAGDERGQTYYTNKKEVAQRIKEFISKNEWANVAAQRNVLEHNNRLVHVILSIA
jgi:hypothetical protein